MRRRGRGRGPPRDGVPAPGPPLSPGGGYWLLHAHAESVLQLVERGQAALVEGLIPQAAQHLPGLLVISAQQSCRLPYCLCLVLLAHRDLPFARFQGSSSSGRCSPPARYGRAGVKTHTRTTPLCCSRGLSGRAGRAQSSGLSAQALRRANHRDPVTPAHLPGGKPGSSPPPGRQRHQRIDMGEPAGSAAKTNPR
jgi:hypothetical protein